MFALIFVLNYLACLLFVFAMMKRHLPDRTTPHVALFEAFFAGSLLFCVQAFFIVEFLSLFNLLSTPGPLGSAYLVFLGVLIAATIPSRHLLRQGFADCRTASTDPFVRRSCYFVGIVLFLPLLVIAVYYPPCTADSMSYHLPKILHWIQNGNVSSYPTNYERQLYVQPFAEYLMLPFELLTGTDFFDNTVQLAAMLGVLFLTALIVRHFGGTGRCQLLAAALVLASPLVVFEAPTTQTDLVVTFFFFSFVYCGLKLLAPGDKNEIRFYAVCMGAALGLGLNTKLSVAPFELPFCVWFGWRFLVVYGRRVWPIYAALVLGFLLFNVPYFTRNYEVSGNLFGSQRIQRQMRNLRFGPDVVFSNTVRNVGMQMLTPVKELNDFNFWFVKRLHESFGIPWNDTTITYTGMGEIAFPYEPLFILDDYRSGNTLTILLFAIVSLSLGGAAVKRYLLPAGSGEVPHLEKRPPPKRKTKKEDADSAENVAEPTQAPVNPLLTADQPSKRHELTVYIWLMVFGFLLFSCLFRWQPFGARLLLPVFLGVIPFTAVGLCRLLEPKLLYRFTVMIFGIAMLFVVFITANSLFYDPLRPLLVFEDVPVDESAGGESQVDQSVSVKNIELVQEYFSVGNTAWEKYLFRRNYQYFRVVTYYLADYLAICNKIDELGATDVGLALDPRIDRWEYPFWPILKSRNPKTRIEWVAFPESLQSTRNYDPDFVPEVIVTDYPMDVIEKHFEIEHVWKYELLILAQVKKTASGAESADETGETTAEHETEPSNP